eukprot:COSAG01_NODE_306_length_19162_cov_14.196611_21_plen_81_part_00
MDPYSTMEAAEKQKQYPPSGQQCPPRSLLIRLSHTGLPYHSSLPGTPRQKRGGATGHRPVAARWLAPGRVMREGCAAAET